MIDVLSYLYEGAHERVAYLLKYQVMDPSSPEYGAIGLHASDPYPQPKHTIYRMTPALCCYCHEGDPLFEDPELYRRMESALAYLSRTQRPSGCWDYPPCNFDSAPDTSFCVKRLIPMYRFLKVYPAKGTERLADEMYVLIAHAAEGILHGGFHTPNHRWAIASVMEACGNVLGEQKYKDRAEAFLKEGIDCNEYGEFSERSAITYNCVNDAAMLMLFEETGEKKYLEYARRNLHMMLTYLEPDDTIFSENSHRQDKGMTAYPRDYFYQFLEVAALTGDDELGKAACRILEDTKKLNLQLAPDCLHLYLLSKPMREYRFPGSSLLENYEVQYGKSGIVRYRDGDFSFTLLEDNPKFLFYRIGAIGGFLRISLGYFDQRHLKATNIRKTEMGYAFDFHADGWYYQPFSDAKGDIVDFFKVDNAKREKIVKNTLDISFSLVKKEHGFDISFTGKGIDGVYMMLEWAVQPDTDVENEGFSLVAKAGDGMVVKSGKVVVRRGMDRFSISPLVAVRDITHGGYGSEPQSPDHFTIYNCLATPFDHTYQVRSF